MYNVYTVTLVLWLLFLNKPYILRLCLKKLNEKPFTDLCYMKLPFAKPRPENQPCLQ